MVDQQDPIVNDEQSPALNIDDLRAKYPDLMGDSSAYREFSSLSDVEKLERGNQALGWGPEPAPGSEPEPEREVLDAGDAWQHFMDNKEKLIPFVVGASDAIDQAELLSAAHAMRDGTSTPEQDKLIEELMRLGAADTTIGYDVVNILGQAFPFALEILTGVGIFTGGARLLGKKAIGAGIAEIVEKAAKESAEYGLGRVVLGVGKTTGNKAMQARGRALMRDKGIAAALKDTAITAAGTYAGTEMGSLGLSTLVGRPGSRTTADAYRRALGDTDFQVTRDNEGQLHVEIEGEVGSFWKALPMAIGSQLIEQGSERMGGHLMAGASRLASPLMRLPVMDRIQTVKAGMSKWFMNKHAYGYTQLREYVGKVGWNGIVEEYMEERFGGVARAFTLVGEDEFIVQTDGDEYRLNLDSIFPSFKQSAAELIAFSIPGAGIAAISTLAGNNNELARAVDAGFWETQQEAEEARKKFLDLLDEHEGFNKDETEELKAALRGDRGIEEQAKAIETVRNDPALTDAAKQAGFGLFEDSHIPDHLDKGVVRDAIDRFIESGDGDKSKGRIVAGNTKWQRKIQEIFRGFGVEVMFVDGGAAGFKAAGRMVKRGNNSFALINANIGLSTQGLLGAATLLTVGYHEGTHALQFNKEEAFQAARDLIDTEFGKETRQLAWEQYIRDRVNKRIEKLRSQAEENGEKRTDDELYDQAYREVDREFRKDWGTSYRARRAREEEAVVSEELAPLLFFMNMPGAQKIIQRLSKEDPTKLEKIIDWARSRINTLLNLDLPIGEARRVEKLAAELNSLFRADTAYRAHIEADSVRNLRLDLFHKNPLAALKLAEILHNLYLAGNPTQLEAEDLAAREEAQRQEEGEEEEREREEAIRQQREERGEPVEEATEETTEEAVEEPTKEEAEEAVRLELNKRTRQQLIDLAEERGIELRGPRGGMPKSKDAIIDRILEYGAEQAEKPEEAKETKEEQEREAKRPGEAVEGSRIRLPDTVERETEGTGQGELFDSPPFPDTMPAEMGDAMGDHRPFVVAPLITEFREYFKAFKKKFKVEAPGKDVPMPEIEDDKFYAWSSEGELLGVFESLQEAKLQLATTFISPPGTPPSEVERGEPVRGAAAVASYKLVPHYDTTIKTQLERQVPAIVRARAELAEAKEAGNEDAIEKAQQKLDALRSVYKATNAGRRGRFSVEGAETGMRDIFVSRGDLFKEDFASGTFKVHPNALNIEGTAEYIPENVEEADAVRARRRELDKGEMTEEQAEELKRVSRIEDAGELGRVGRRQKAKDQTEQAETADEVDRTEDELEQATVSERQKIADVQAQVDAEMRSTPRNQEEYEAKLLELRRATRDALEKERAAAQEEWDNVEDRPEVEAITETIKRGGSKEALERLRERKKFLTRKTGPYTQARQRLNRVNSIIDRINDEINVSRLKGTAKTALKENPNLPHEQAVWVDRPDLSNAERLYPDTYLGTSPINNEEIFVYQMPDGGYLVFDGTTAARTKTHPNTPYKARRALYKRRIDPLVRDAKIAVQARRPQEDIVGVIESKRSREEHKADEGRFRRIHRRDLRDAERVAAKLKEDSDASQAELLEAAVQKYEQKRKALYDKLLQILETERAQNVNPENVHELAEDDHVGNELIESGGMTQRSLPRETLIRMIRLGGNVRTADIATYEFNHPSELVQLRLEMEAAREAMDQLTRTKRINETNTADAPPMDFKPTRRGFLQQVFGAGGMVFNEGPLAKLISKIATEPYRIQVKVTAAADIAKNAGWAKALPGLSRVFLEETKGTMSLPVLLGDSEHHTVEAPLELIKKLMHDRELSGDARDVLERMVHFSTHTAVANVTLEEFRQLRAQGYSIRDTHGRQVAELTLELFETDWIEGMRYATPDLAKQFLLKNPDKIDEWVFFLHKNAMFGLVNHFGYGFAIDGETSEGIYEKLMSMPMSERHERVIDHYEQRAASWVENMVRDAYQGEVVDQAYEVGERDYWEVPTEWDDGAFDRVHREIDEELNQILKIVYHGLSPLSVLKKSEPISPKERRQLERLALRRREANLEEGVGARGMRRPIEQMDMAPFDRDLLEDAQFERGYREAELEYEQGERERMRREAEEEAQWEKDYWATQENERRLHWMDMPPMQLTKTQRKAFGKGKNVPYTTIDTVLEAVFNKWTPVGHFEKALKRMGVKLTEESLATLREILRKGKTSAEIKHFERHFIEPILDVLNDINGKYGTTISWEAASNWSKGTHALERNPHLEKYTDQESSSGISKDKAKKLISEAEKEGTPEQWKEYQRLTRKLAKEIRDMNVRNGLSTAEEAEILASTYKDYVPLMRVEMVENQVFTHASEQEVQAYEQYISQGAGIDLRSKDYRYAYGQKSFPKGDALQNLMGAGLLAIHRGEKAKVGQALLSAVRQANKQGVKQFAVLELPALKYGLNKDTKKFDELPDPGHRLNEEVVVVAENGKRYEITFSSDMVHVARALKSGNVKELGLVVGTIAPYTRLLAALTTRQNPAFVIPNFFRDAGTAFLNLTNQYGAAEAHRLVNMKQIWRSLTALRKARALKNKNQWDAKKIVEDAKNGRATVEPDLILLARYEIAGGPITTFDMGRHEAAAGYHRRVTDYQNPPTGLKAAKASARDILSFMEDLNDIVENGSRFAFFMNAIDGGLSSRLGVAKTRADSQAAAGIPLSSDAQVDRSEMSDDEAAMHAKQLTVNFEQRGTKGAALNGLYMFANASIQSTGVIFNTIFHEGPLKGNVEAKKVGILGKEFTYPADFNRRMSGHAKKWLPGIVGFHFALGMLNALASGVDDDDGESYWAKIPDYEKQSNIIFYIPGSNGKFFKIPMPYGYNFLAALGYNLADFLLGNKDMGESMGFAGTTAVTALSPFGGATSIADVITPTAVKPLFEIERNRDWKGSSIYKKRYGDNTIPDSQLYFDSVNPILREVTEWLNDVTGGNEYKSGAIDVNPATIEHLMKSVVGGLGAFGVRSATAVAKAFSPEEEMYVRDIPFARRFFSGENPHAAASMYRENRDRIIQIERQAKAGIPLNEEDRFLLGLNAVRKSTETRVRKLREIRNKLELGDSRRAALENQERAIMNAFNLRFNRAIMARQSS